MKENHILRLIGLKSKVNRFCIVILFSTVIVAFSMSFSLSAQNKQLFFDIETALANKKDLKCSDFIDRIDYIPLETSDKCLLGKISSVLYHVDFFLISSKDQPVMQFDTSGKFIREIGKIGRGPGEYVRAGRVFIDDNLSEIIVIDIRTRKLLRYSYSGVFLGWRSFPHHYAQLWYLSANRIVGIIPRQQESDNVLFRSFLVDSSNAVKPLIIDDSKLEFGPESIQEFFSCFKFGKSWLFYPPKSDTIYFVEGQSLKPKAILMRGSLKMPNSYYKDRATFNTYKDKYIPFIYLLPHSSSKISIIADYNGKTEVGFLDLNAGDLYFIDSTDGEVGEVGIINDIDGGPNYLPYTHFNDGIACNALNTLDLKELYNDGYFSGRNAKSLIKKRQFMELLDTISETDNPVIMKIVLFE
ncbi:MAG: 6-bladed beta-propeller [Bacteroidota bacterium]|nr:6-bladed beta-propeller [Bacteroidota bacterium]